MGKLVNQFIPEFYIYKVEMIKTVVILKCPNVNLKY